MEKSFILAFMDIFLKIANHPALLREKTAYSSILFDEIIGLDSLARFHDDPVSIETCGKLKVYIFVNENSPRKLK